MSSNPRTPRRKRIIVALTGATGSILGIETLIALRRLDVETHLIISKWAENTLKYETDYTVANARALADTVYGCRYMAAPVASGSFQVDVIFPPVPAFYIKPSSVDDLVDHGVGRMLDLFDLDTEEFDGWDGFQKP
ncbi:Flavin prenyltransferase PAD1, mitochondrial [Fusarium falciforme]|uniref:Flavin prenyltransferase PAD1, mitochondrial n=1 Tax=Fusarium falciforme TaxID=195108 RepID=UPI002300FE9A|nr:Flavin prenyltransferase PAD1, mitochondrial [Fusarium falciforme]WAO90409.1 Flavin prenyltransferase PAD1, mitochondrial [Fusarium falciforme]